MTGIEKNPIDRARFRLRRRFTVNARTAWASLLRAIDDERRTVLLPSYIGESPLEGSGVFDPIRETRARFRFYRLNQKLEPDLAHVEALLAEEPAELVLAIHYFGFPAGKVMEFRDLCYRAGSLFVEDCAHALSSKVEGRPLGSVGDYSFFSIHKMLPTGTGGFLQVASDRVELPEIAGADRIEPEARALFDSADLATIGAIRRRNYARQLELVARIEGVEPFVDALPEGVVPQTLPLRIVGRDRFEVYKSMRAENVGVVALYHTLVDEIEGGEFPVSHEVSQSILNLPVHQEITDDECARIAESLASAMAGR